MVFFNYATMQMAAKIVYYGPGLCGKTTNLHHIYGKTAPQSRGEMVSLETETDRTLFFDLLPLDVGVIGGFKTRLQLYTVPGQVFYNTTRKLVLKGVDGIVFVVDSQRPMIDANIESFRNLKENLAEIGVTLDQIPVVLQYNKRDLANVASVEELNKVLNTAGDYETHEACAVNGLGVFETLKGISKQTLKALRKRMTGGEERKPAVIAKPAPPRPSEAPAAGSRISQNLSSLQARMKSGSIQVSPPRPEPSPLARPVTTLRPAASAPPSTTLGAENYTVALKIPPRIVPPPELPGIEMTEEVPEEIQMEEIQMHEEVPPQALEAAAAGTELASPITMRQLPLGASVLSETEEVKFSQTAEAEPIREPVMKRVKVRSNVDIFAEIDKLRKKSTTLAPGAKEGSRDVLKTGKVKAPSFPEELAEPSLNHRKEISKELRLSVRKGNLARASSCKISLVLQDASKKTIESLENHEVTLKDLKDIEKLLLNLKIQITSE